MNPREQEKANAARAAVACVQSGMLVGLGSGSTAAYAVRLLGERVRIENLRITGVPTSPATRALAVSCGIPLLADLDGFRLDMAIDGADEVTRTGAAIKGGGGALFHERIVAAAAAEFILICDSSKIVDQLGAFPLPVEVSPFGWRNAQNRLRDLGCNPTLRHDERGQPLRTEEHHLILDCDFSPHGIADPHELDSSLRAIPGVIDTGLFLGLAHRIFVGRADRVEEIVLA
jgi:ribose 5-phosphate isomerase A